MFARSRHGAKKPSCLNNLKQIGVGLAQYTQDYDERLPLIVGAARPTATRPYGWADALFPYIKSKQLFQCPQQAQIESSALPTARGYTDYWFNSYLAGFENKNARTPAQTLTFADGNDGGDLTDARYNLLALPAAWINDKNSPLYRHLDGANYAFLDGHVKWLTLEIVSNAPVAQSKATFSPR
jgi:prepilin-type processing-associated H-X9-DG protein